MGTVVNDEFRLDTLLGIGGMAAVYACSRRNGVRKALKILHPEFARDKSITERFLREGYVANRIDHPGRVAIEDDGVTDDGEPFLVMELLEGETVQQLWKKRGYRVPVEEALWIASEVLDTLCAFHAESIVHRDIKPANVFVTRQRGVKVLDFGVARMREATGDTTRAGTALGTPSFMAPEQAMGLVDVVDGRADIFSIGATLFALLSGRRLHQGHSDNDAFILAATTPAPSLARLMPELPAPVTGLVDKALAWDRRNRFETAAAMRDECLRIVAGLREKNPALFRDEERGGNRSQTVEFGELRRERSNDKSVPEIFRRFERLLLALRYYGESHPEAHAQFRSTHEVILEALRAEGSALCFRLSPHAFEWNGQVVWEPEPPLDAIPYHLFAANIRTMELTLGFSEADLHGLCQVLMLEPDVDLGPEDDLAIALWERQLVHVRFDVVDGFANGGAAEREAFWLEAEELEAIIRRPFTDEMASSGAAASAITGIDVTVQQAESLLALDPATRKALGGQLVLSVDRVRERFVDVVAEVLIRARRRDETDLLPRALDEWTRERVGERRPDRAFQMFATIDRALAAMVPRSELTLHRMDLAASMFSPETLRRLLRDLVAPPSLGVSKMGPQSRDVATIIGLLGPSHLEAILETADLVTSEVLATAISSYLERTIPGHEGDIAAAVVRLDIIAARPIMNVLAGMRTKPASEVLRRLAREGSATLRCEAIVLLGGSPDEICKGLQALLCSREPEARLAALQTLGRHQIKLAEPMVVGKVIDPSFQRLSVEERRETLATLAALNPERAEAVSVELLQLHGALATEDSSEQTRALCAELLGREARSMEALVAVVGASKPHPWNSPLVRGQASVAAEAMATRMGKNLDEIGDRQ